MAEEPENVQEEQVAEDATASEATDSTTSDAAASSAASGGSTASGGGPQEQLTPKERRSRGRAQRAASRPARSQMSPEERQQEREAERRRKAAARRQRRLQERERARAGRQEVAPTPPREHQPGTQKVRQGVVVSDKADKTITVRIDLARRHRRYDKIVRTSTTLHAHDESNDAHVGDRVVVREARPLSRSKRWRLVEVVERAR
jgi:small subunit ribosomal protein S17